MKNKIIGLLLATIICVQVPVQASTRDKIKLKIADLKHLMQLYPKISIILGIFLGYNIFVGPVKKINATIHNKIVDNLNKDEKDQTGFWNWLNWFWKVAGDEDKKSNKEITVEDKNKNKTQQKVYSMREAYKRSIKRQYECGKEVVDKILQAKLFYGGLLTFAAVVYDNRDALNTISQSFSKNTLSTTAISIFGTLGWHQLTQYLTNPESKSVAKALKLAEDLRQSQGALSKSKKENKNLQQHLDDQKFILDNLKKDDSLNSETEDVIRH